MAVAQEHARRMEPVDILEQDWFDQGVIKNPAAAGAVNGGLLGRDFLLPNIDHAATAPSGQPRRRTGIPDAGSIITHVRAVTISRCYYVPQR